MVSTIDQAFLVGDVCMFVIGICMLIVLGIVQVKKSQSKHAQFAPVLIFLGNLAPVALLLWDVSVRLFFAEYVSVAIVLITTWLIAAIAMHAWLAVTSSLYSAFNQAQDRTALMDLNLDDAQKAKLLEKLKFYRKLLTPKHYVYFFLGCLLLFQIPLQVAIIFIFPELHETPFAEVGKLSGLHFLTLEIGGAAHVMILKIPLIVLAKRTRIVVDSLGIKSMLIGVAKSLIACSSLYLLAQTIQVILLPHSLVLHARNIAIYSVGLSMFYVGVSLPLNRSLNQDDECDGVASSEGQHKLQGFIRIPKYSDAFQKHLQTEYSVENLQFWLSVDQFEGRFGPSSPECGNFRGRNEAGLEIYRMFLRAKAPQEVNLPYEILNSFRDDIFASVDGSGEATVVPDDAISFLQCPYDVFAEAKYCIFELLQKDSFPRFLKKKENAKMWDEYLQREIESNVMMNLNTTTKFGTPVSGLSGMHSSFGGTSDQPSANSSQQYH